MRKLSLALTGAVALASASAAEATILVVPPTDVTVTDVFNGPTSSYITYQKPSGQTGSFSDILSFSNDTAGVFNLSVLTQVVAAVHFTTLTISGGTLSGPMTLLDPWDIATVNGATTYALGSLNLGVGTYHINLAGTAPLGTTWQGTVNFSAVPEPATWGLMLLGFGLMGASMRRRRTRVALPQLA
jgi:PEP-CTERM motif